MNLLLRVNFTLLFVVDCCVRLNADYAVRLASDVGPLLAAMGCPAALLLWAMCP